jgi:predicted PurR-regulated permease PerM
LDATTSSAIARALRSLVVLPNPYPRGGIVAFQNAAVDRIRRRRGMTQTGEEAPRAPLLEPPGRRPTPYERFVRIGIVAWCGIGVIVLAYLLVRMMVYVNPVVPPLLLAVAVVYLLNPLVSALERRGVPRVAGAGIVYVLFLCIMALVVSLLAPVVTRQVETVIDHFPDYLADGQARLRQLAARFGQEPDFRLDAEQVRQWLSAGENRQAVTRYLTGLRSVTSSLLSGLIIFVLGPVMAFYLLVDLPRLKRGAMALIPPARRAEINGLMERVGQAVGGFFRGQLLVALFVGVASSIGLWAIGLPFWLLVGMVAGVFNLVPLVGPFIGGALAVIIALVGGQPLKALWAALVLLAVQQVDNHLISPNVMGRTVQLHPVVVMLALLVGASFAGLFGMLVIVPLVAVAKIVFLFIWSKYVVYGEDLTQGSPD